MGNMRSRGIDCRPMPKSSKIEHEHDTDNCSSNSTNSNQTQSITSYFTTSSHVSYQKWEHLPYVALVNVYNHLAPNDKASLSRTCKTWSIPFNRPALWRRGNFWFDGVRDWRAMRYAALMGSALRHLNIDCAASEEKSYARTKTTSANFSCFLNSLLTSQNRKLGTFCLRNLNRLVWQAFTNDGFRDTFESLVSILNAQENIRTLDITNAGLIDDSVFRLLESIPCPHRMKQLYITEAVSPSARFNLVQTPRFVRLMANFSALTDIGISDEYISHDLLITLSRTLSLTLRRMEVKALYDVRRRPREELDEAWETLCGHMSNLNLLFAVEGSYAGQNVKKILPSTLRLCRLEWNVGNFLTDHKSFFLHVGIFKNSLNYLVLRIRIITETDVDYLVRLVKRLTNLKVLLIDSPMMPSSSQNLLESSIRRHLCVMKPENRVLNHVYINGNELCLQESWSSIIIEWLSGYN